MPKKVLAYDTRGGSHEDFFPPHPAWTQALLNHVRFDGVKSELFHRAIGLRPNRFPPRCGVTSEHYMCRMVLWFGCAEGPSFRAVVICARSSAG